MLKTTKIILLFILLEWTHIVAVESNPTVVNDDYIPLKIHGEQNTFMLMGSPTICKANERKDYRGDCRLIY